MSKLVFLLSFFMIPSVLFAQVPVKKKTAINLDETIQSIQPGATNPNNNNTSSEPRKDTIGFEHRNDLKDSINISYKYLDSTRKKTMDSTINDFDNYFSVPSNYVVLGNNGAAAYPIIFQPNDRIGFDAGLHAFDLYRYTLATTKFYKTSRPFSALSYQLASGKEQMIKAFHTQNPKPNWNFGFDFNLITAPGFFVTQNTNHSSYRVFSQYQSPKKRYQIQTAIINNRIRASENGGVENAADLSDPNRKDRFSVPVNLGNNAAYRTNPFVTSILTGNTQTDLTVFLRQQYDLGKKDSVAINDSTVDYLFYPKLRLQHTVTYQKLNYLFSDIYADSSVYKNWYNINFDKPSDTFSLKESWKSISNDFSLIQFPDTKNTAQYFLAGVTLQQLNGIVGSGKVSMSNCYVHGTYQNRTRNKLWDISLDGTIYASGPYAGDYQANANISRIINPRLGYLKLYFKNANRTPSFIFDSRSAFHLGDTNAFKKENVTTFGATATSPFISLAFNNITIANFVYFKNYYQSVQNPGLINLIQFSASKKWKLTKRWNWYMDATIQQIDGAAPIRVPLLFTRNRLAFEGLFFRNLNLSAGLEMKYHSPYKANAYSPILGQFAKQDSLQINNLPDIAAYAHFRIKGFAGYLRAENLNTMDLSNGLSFTRNNFAAPLYPTQGLMIRFGIQWWFVN